MFNFQEANLENIIVHWIGNKSEEESTHLSNRELAVDDEITEILKAYFLTPFKPEEYFHLDKEGTVFEHVKAIFENPSDFIGISKEIAEYLYQQSEHPKIKSGELYVTRFTDCIVDGEMVEAVGLFKSESKDMFLRVVSDSDTFQIIPETGINAAKLDKGCLIFNTESENGYLVSVVDSSGKGNDAQFWRNYFLKLKTRRDDFYHTKNYLDLCKSFVVEHAPKEFEVTKADQADFLNKSASFFKKNQEFDMSSFTEEVIPQPEIAESFKEYKKQYEEEKEVKLEDEFSISLPAVKKQAKALKSVIKLDKNFHIYVHGNRENIVKGFDEQTGMHYYQIFYKEEE